MGRERLGSDSAEQPDMGWAEAGLAVLLEACEQAVEEIGSTVPPVQMRALLVIDRARKLNLKGLARALGASASATSRLTDRMQAAGLLRRDRATLSRREIMLVPTDAGRRLAEWVRSQRRAALGVVLAGMSADGGAALASGLTELARRSKSALPRLDDVRAGRPQAGRPPTGRPQAAGAGGAAGQ
jgi:DNA-binding MarR family transcriptional regulator